MVRPLLAALVGALAGALAVWSLSPRSNPPPAPAHPALAHAPPPATSPIAPAIARARPVVRRAAFVPPPPPPAPDATVPALREENAELREQLEAVTKKLRSELQANAEANGVPREAPANLAPRFEGEALREAMTTALVQAGFANAEVTSVDCTEYPCILYGDGMGSKEDFDKLEKAEAMQPYASDSHSAMGWGSRGEDGRPHEEFGLALYPREPTNEDQQALAKRLAYRARQMREGD